MTITDALTEGLSKLGKEAHYFREGWGAEWLVIGHSDNFEVDIGILLVMPAQRLYTLTVADLMAKDWGFVPPPTAPEEPVSVGPYLIIETLSFIDRPDWETRVTEMLMQEIGVAWKDLARVMVPLTNEDIQYGQTAYELFRPGHDSEPVMRLVADDVRARFSVRYLWREKGAH